MAVTLDVCVWIGLLCVYCVSAKYNVLFLQSDEMDGRVLDRSSPIWNIAEMPNLRGLAKEGINFVNNYCNSPLCAPSRASMWTGRYTNNILAWSNVKSITAQVENPNEPDPTCKNIIGYGEQWCVNMGKQQNIKTTIKQSMLAAGYNVQLYGKMDIGGGMGGGYHSSSNGNWSNQLKGCNISTSSYCPGDIIHSWARKANVTRGEYLPPNKGDWISINSKQGGFYGPHDEKVTNQCLEYIDNYAKSNNQKPFLLYCSMINPHPPYWSNSTWLKKLNYNALNQSFEELINNFNNSFNRMNEADKYNSICESVGEIPINTKWAYNLYQAYWATCSELDYWMGLIINKLKQYPDLYDNTLIIYTSDHGEMHLEHLQLEKMSMYEPSARVPLIVKGPNIPTNKVINNNFTTLVDIFPTFLDAANISYENQIYPKNLNGYSLSPFFDWKWINNDKNNPYLKRPDYAFSEYHGEQTNTGQYMLREGNYKLILYAINTPFTDYKPQLFDVIKDPNELNNIAQENSDIVKSMTNIINNILEKTGGGDYNFVDAKCQNEGKQNFLRWQKEIDGTDSNKWIKYVNATYTYFDENDVQKMKDWMK